MYNDRSSEREVYKIIKNFVLMLCISGGIFFILYANNAYWKKRTEIRESQAPTVVEQIEICRRGKYDMVIYDYLCKPRKDGKVLLVKIKIGEKK